MRNVLFSLFCLVLLVLFFQTVTAQEAKKTEATTPDAPKLTLEEHDKLSDLEKQSLQVYIQITTVTKKYQDAMNADPEYQNLQKQNNEIGNKLSTAISDVQKRIDPTEKKWKLNPQSLMVEHSKPEEAPKAAK